MRVALDCESTGIDLHHGARPFFVTVCYEDGTVKFWEWYVDLYTREPRIPPQDVEEIREVIHSADRIIGQNFKFDVAALATIGIKDFPWDKVDDTLIAGHLLASGQPHNLTDMALQYLGVNIEPYEIALRNCCMKARNLCRNKTHKDKGWRIAKAGLPDMPSAKGGGKSAKKGVESDSPWKFDTWLLQSLAYELNLSIPEPGCKHVYNDIYGEGEFYCDKCGGHRWWIALAEYANTDSPITMALWQKMEQEIERRGLWKIYLMQMELPPIVSRMEKRGITVSAERLDELTNQYQEFSCDARSTCINIAASVGYELDMPVGATPNQSLRNFIFDHLKLPKIYAPKAKSPAPTLNADALKTYINTLPERSKGKAFISNLVAKRSRDTAITYMEGYKRYWQPLTVDGCEGSAYQIPDWYVLHPSLNQTGTNTLRFSCSNPNEQNISARENFNLRYCFGPAPGREWWSFDAKNIELRIPAYESGEEAFIELFERPDDPPYFGSNHALIAHVLFPKEFEACINEDGVLDGRIFKERHGKGIYRKVKGFNFAVQYGAVDREDGEGTADRTVGISGAQARVKSRFVKQEALNQKWIAYANKYGYVETIPDKDVDPTRGYPVLCARTDYGRIKPTVPLNYHVQSTAMWWTRKAMIRVEAKLAEWRDSGFDAWMVLQVHDELVIDMPRKGDPRIDLDPSRKDGMKLFRKTNLWRVRQIQEIMASCGEGISVPTPVGCEWHPISWDVGITL